MVVELSVIFASYSINFYKAPTMKEIILATSNAGKIKAKLSLLVCDNPQAQAIERAKTPGLK